MSTIEIKIDVVREDTFTTLYVSSPDNDRIVKVVSEDGEIISVEGRHEGDEFEPLDMDPQDADGIPTAVGVHYVVEGWGNYVPDEDEAAYDPDEDDDDWDDFDLALEYDEDEIQPLDGERYEV